MLYVTKELLMYKVYGRYSIILRKMKLFIPRLGNPWTFFFSKLKSTVAIYENNIRFNILLTNGLAPAENSGSRECKNIRQDRNLEPMPLNFPAFY